DKKAKLESEAKRLGGEMTKNGSDLALAKAAEETANTPAGRQELRESKAKHEQEIASLKDKIKTTKKKIEGAIEAIETAPGSEQIGWREQLASQRRNLAAYQQKLTELAPKGDGVTLASFGAKADAWAGAGAKGEAKLGFTDAGLLQLKLEGG